MEGGAGKETGMSGWTIGAFIAGELAGLVTAALISGLADRINERRKRKHEQEDIRNFYQRTGGGDHGDGRDRGGEGERADLGQ